MWYGDYIASGYGDPKALGFALTTIKPLNTSGCRPCVRAKVRATLIFRQRLLSISLESFLWFFAACASHPIGGPKRISRRNQPPELATGVEGAIVDDLWPVTSTIAPRLPGFSPAHAAAAEASATAGGMYYPMAFVFIIGVASASPIKSKPTSPCRDNRFPNHRANRSTMQN